VRIVVYALRGIGDADLVQHVDAFLRAVFLSVCRCSIITSDICLQMLTAGFNEVIGSWNTMEILPPRT
jgi:hypothetical protein